MNNLLFTALLIALLYYFFYYLPQQKKLTQNPPTLFENKETQTDELELSANHDTITQLEKDNQELLKDNQAKERTISGLNNSYQKLATKTKNELAKLTEQLQEKEKQITELKSAEKTLDEMLKNIQDLNQELN